MEDSKLKVVKIYFDTATYDVVEKDQKVTNIGWSWYWKFWKWKAKSESEKWKLLNIYFDTATYDVVEKDQKVMIGIGWS